MRLIHHMWELEEALRDRERYQRIPKEQFLQDRDTQNMIHHAMLLSIPAGNRHSDQCDCRGGVEKPLTYRETFEVLAGEGVIPEPLARDLSNLAGFRNLLVHVYWDPDLKQVYAILQHDLAVLRAFSGIMKEHVSESDSAEQDGFFSER
ncbi:DUF86 domain-containing protein [Methanoculleus sp. YWC-01]|jgi:uncharacterized protein YutE (UPF0331/DUF86 family)|uniref:DUF86 domain-containing protein n=1 Tax=Methanoculleus nereidis TaxID=2735141 RepID=A0ABU3Z2B9_9EURY|nr:DUF86 domain-containing protein [Methanoculleus sp. YWC-01]MCK9298695.1 DUF86 domain-containing protein [Methanoculleus sp.]MDV4342965.1 DUF86 domain-containing protein [Methanoculleus sp. YWC-01]